MWRVLVGLWLLCALLSHAADQKGALAAANQGLQSAQQGQYREAIAAYRRALALDPQLGGLPLNLGLAYFKLGEFQNAIAPLEQAHAQQPTSQTGTLLALSYAGAGRPREAAARLKLLVDAQPSNTELAYLLARNYLASAQYPEAMAVFQSLLQRDPNSAATHMLLGEALDAYSRTAEAAQEFEVAARVAPAQPEVHFGLGYLYWKLRRYDEARPEFESELNRNPQHGRASAYLGDTLLKQNQNAAAEPLLLKAAALEPKLVLPHYDLGVLYTAAEKSEQAVAQYRAAINVDASDYSSHYRLARLLQKMGRSAEAQEEFRTVQKLQEKKTEAPLLNINGASK